MALESLTDPTTWSAGLVLASDTVFQCREGSVLLTWDALASVGDGFLLEQGQSIIVPSGNTVRWAAAGSPDSELFHESFA